jgi:hypothetical protein
MPLENILTIQTPLEAPQYPLDGGWWQFELDTVDYDPDDHLVLRIKNAGSRFEFLASWLSDQTGHTISRESHPQLWDELSAASKDLPMVQLT